jgi:chemotaxis protein methyltransferase CheR
MADYDKLAEWLKSRTGIDLASYKSVQMRRRLTGLMESLGLCSFQDYIELLEQDPAAFDQFLKRLTINVSDFFRNPERFEALRQSMLPRLLSEREQLLIWSAGCANGSEAYTLAIILHELAPGSLPEQRILATDIDKRSLQQAEQGIYTESELKGLDPKRKERYFRQKDRNFQVRDLLRIIEFKQHNLLDDPFPKGCDLILCRNVVIYFTQEAKERLYPRLREALRPGGVLMVGGTEPILRYAEYGFQRLGPGFYRREEL